MSNVTSNATQTQTLASARALPIAMAFMLGVLLVAGAGFASASALHNAAHDQRHSLGFPCH